MSGAASARVTARLLMVCAALAGLFLMHGLPAQSCAGGAGSSGMTMASTPWPAADVALGLGDAVRMADGVSAAGTMGSGHGGVCVSTAPPLSLDTLLRLLLAVALALGVAAPSCGPEPGPRTSRAPPRAGSQVLTRLCVSRT